MSFFLRRLVTLKAFLWLKAFAAFVLFLLANQASAAQLIDSLPSEMETRWKVCQHFENRVKTCQTQNLPLRTQRYQEDVVFQTFEKQFVLSSDLKKLTFGLYLPRIDDVDEVYINGELIGRTGKFLPSFESGFRYPRLYLIPSDLINFNQFNQIKIKTNSSRNLPGVQTKAPIIGNYSEIQHQIQETNYLYLIASSLLLLLIVFQLFYFAVVKNNYEALYFSVFLIAFSIVSIARSMLPLELGLDLSATFKIEVFMHNLGMAALAIFIFSMFELEFRRIYQVGLAAIGISGLATILWPFTVSLRLISEINLWIVIVCSFLVIGSALIIAIHKQRKYSWLVFSTCSVGWLILIYDALMLSPGMFRVELPIISSIVPVTATFIGLIFSLTLTHKYWRFFKGSTYDHLTGTLLRPAFFQRLSEEMQRSQRGNSQLLIAVIDIQQAKKISTSYGYSLGNHLLTTVSNALTKVLRPFDLICRFSDEQFCIAASIVGRQDAESCIQRVYEELINIEQPIDKGVEVYVDARVGGVIYNPDQHLSVSHLLQDANYALSKAKSQSKNNYLLLQNPTVTA